MFKEKSSFREELPVNVLTVNIQDYPIHFCDDLQLIYVLKGDVVLKCGYYEYKLHQGDVFAINPRETHSLNNGSLNNMVMMLKLNNEYFKKYHVEIENSFFMVDSKSVDSIPVLRDLMKKVMIEILEKGYGYEHKIIENCHNLISCLLTDFKCEDVERNAGSSEKKYRLNKILAQRLGRINNFIYNNYHRKVTLNEIAENEGLSIYYLSHVIKEATGLSFQDFLSFVRVEESKKFLTRTNKKIGAISQEMGFSAVRYYIKHFKSWYGIHPLEYRKNGQEIELQKTDGMFKRSFPVDIEVALVEQKDFHEEYTKKQKNKPIILEMNFINDKKYDEQEEFEISKLLKKETMKPMNRSYMLMSSLNEKIVKSGENFMISVCEKDSDSLCITLLVYNIFGNIKNNLEEANSREKVKEIAENYDDETEILLKCQVPAGEYSVSRYKVSTQNVLMAYEESIKHSALAEKRNTLINSWSTLPDVEFNSIVTSESLSVRTTLKGISAELILIDKK